MIQLVYKRLIYFVFLWTCVCFIVYRLATNDQGDKGYDYFSSSFPVSKIPDNNNINNAQKDILLDNPLDYEILSSTQSTSDSNSNQYIQQPKLKIDTSPLPNETQIYLQLSSKSNLPLDYWSKIRKSRLAELIDFVKRESSKKKSCQFEFPSLFEVDYNNIYWQKVQTRNASFYLYGAYYDDRPLGGPLPTVRILAMIDRLQPPIIYCHFWFEQSPESIQSQANYTYGWFSKWGKYEDGFLQPFVIDCPIPRTSKLSEKLVPVSVSLVSSKCEKARNNLRVINNRPQVKQDFAVCVKGLDFQHEDLSVRLIEWIELLELLGAKKIFFYQLDIHPNISKVLNYYQERGLVELTPITLPGNLPNLPGFRHFYLKNQLTIKRQNELIPYNDCLYRNIYSYSYLALLDIDEVIMPLKHSNWSELMATVEMESLKLKNFSRASYNVRNVYFLDDLADEQGVKHTGHEPGIPPYLHMLQHVYRSRSYTKPGQYVKCFHNTERVVSVHNHFPRNCFENCTTYSINLSLAQLQHYRQDCVGPLKRSCNTEFRSHTIRDTTIWKYKDQLIKNCNFVLEKLGFIKFPASFFY